MKLPIFEEIILIDFTPQTIKRAFYQHNIGKAPYFIILHEKSKEILYEQLESISYALIELGQNTSLPYPLYLVTELIESYEDLLFVPTIKDLPNHFYRKSKKLKSKEQILFNRVQITAHKISNEDSSGAISKIKMSFFPSKELYNKTKEANFYEKVLKKLSSSKGSLE